MHAVSTQKENQRNRTAKMERRKVEGLYKKLHEQRSPRPNQTYAQASGGEQDSLL